MLRKTLLVLALFWTVLILVVGLPRAGVPVDFPTSESLQGLLHMRDPRAFVGNLAAKMGAAELEAADFRGLLGFLEDTARMGPGDDMVSAEGVRGAVLLRFGDPAGALACLQRARRETRFGEERESLLILEAWAHRRLGDRAGLARVFTDLEEFERFPGEEGMPADLPPVVAVERGWLGLIGWCLVWLGLIAAPGFLTERERRAWLRRNIPPEERAGAYLQIRLSPTLALGTICSGLAFLVLDLPGRLGIGSSIVLALGHMALAMGAGLWPRYLLDREIRQTTWTFPAFLLTSGRFLFLTTAAFLVPVLAGWVLHLQVRGLALWPVLWPLGLGLGFPALCGAGFLLLPLLLPLVLGFRRLPPETAGVWQVRPGLRLYRWDLAGSAIFNGWSFGYLSPTHAIVMTGPLLDGFTPDEVASIAAHEEGHLQEGHLFLFFLVLLNAALLVGVYAVVWPLRAQQWLMGGWGLHQLLGLAVVFLLLRMTFSALSRRCELAADARAAAVRGREAYLRALERLVTSNFLPAHQRENEPVLASHPSLAFRKRALREAAGEVFDVRTTPPDSLLVALWRARLGFEWKSGVEEATQLCSLDDHLPEKPALEQFRELARRQTHFGAECLVSRDPVCLEVLRCAQKAVTAKADPPLPTAQVCALCHGGMEKALGPSRPCRWEFTGPGCLLTLRREEPLAVPDAPADGKTQLQPSV